MDQVTLLIALGAAVLVAGFLFIRAQSGAKGNGASGHSAAPPARAAANACR